MHRDVGCGTWGRRGRKVRNVVIDRAASELRGEEERSAKAFPAFFVPCANPMGSGPEGALTLARGWLGTPPLAWSLIG